MTERYRFYRVHKFLVAYINDMSRLIARSDFTNDNDIQTISTGMDGLISLLYDHAHYEDRAFHSLLEAKGSQAHLSIQRDHEKHHDMFDQWRRALDDIANDTDPQSRMTKGYQFYLAFRSFEADNLHHLNEEEMVLMPELQRLYSDKALKQVSAQTYKQDLMTPKVMVSMLKTIFPYADKHDRLAFLEEIHEATPEKFKTVFEAVLKEKRTDGSMLIDEHEQIALRNHFSLTPELTVSH